MKLKRFILFIILSILLISVQVYGTVSTSTSRIKHACNGALTGFTFTFGVNETEEVEVVHTDSGGTETTLTETTNYAISCTNNDCSAGGTCTTVATYALGEYITILRNVPLTQESDFTEGMATLYETFENELDKGRRIDQQLQEQITRTPKLPKSSAYAGNDYTFPDPDSGKIIGWNAGATDLTTFETSSATTIDISTLERIGDYSNNISTAVTSIGASEKTLLIDVATAGDTTIPSNINLWFIRGGSLTGTVVIYSPENIRAPYTQSIFTDAATISFTVPGTDSPDWWGIDGTADQVQFQAANDAFSSGGSIFASGIYSFTAAVNLSSNVHLYGNGKSSSITTVGDIYAISVSGAAVYPNDIRGVLVEKLALYGTGTPAAGGGIYFQNAHECCFQNLWISDHSKTLFYGIHFAGATFNDTDNNIIRDNIITKTVDTSIYLYTTDPAAIEENVISGNIITGAGRNGISVVGSRNTITGNTIEESGWHGLVLSNVHWNTVTGNTACESARHGISLESGSYENTVTGNICKDNDVANSTTWNGIDLDNGDRNIIVGNICYNNDNYEISLDGTSSNNIVFANECYGTDHVGTILDSGTGNLVLHNLEVLANFDSGISITTFTDGDTTPSVLVNTNYPHVYGCANSGATTITQFHDGQAGQIIIVRIDGSTTVQNNADMLLAGGADFSGDANDIITLLCVATDEWKEVSRSTN